MNAAFEKFLARYEDRSRREKVLWGTEDPAKMIVRMDELLLHVGEEVARWLNALAIARLPERASSGHIKCQSRSCASPFEEESAVLVELGDYAFKHVTAVQNLPIDEDWSVRVAFNGSCHYGYNNSGTYNDCEMYGLLRRNGNQCIAEL